MNIVQSVADEQVEVFFPS